MTIPSPSDFVPSNLKRLRLFSTSIRMWLSRLRAHFFWRRFKFRRTGSWSTPVDSLSLRTVSSVTGEGLNLLGYLSGEFGLAEAARSYARAAVDAGIRVALNDVNIQTPHSHGDRRLQDWIDTTPLPFCIDLVFVNPDHFSRAIEQGVGRLLPRCHLMAFWFWELPSIPQQWDQAIGQVDEILVASDYVAQAFRKRTDKPVTKIPYPLYQPAPSALARRDFGLTEDTFVFLVTFDFNSSVKRKNPAAAIAAFREAFPRARNDVRLLVKSSNGHRYQTAFAELATLAEGDSRILLRDDVLPSAHMHALQASCDAYVSLHRAEGLGLGLAECMSLGKPVIATAWSGNLEFMSEDNSLLVNARLVPVPAADYPFAEDQHWAEPDVTHAAKLMRALADDRAMAARLGAAAASHVRHLLNPGRASAALAEHLRMVINSKLDNTGSPRGVVA